MCSSVILIDQSEGYDTPLLTRMSYNSFVHWCIIFRCKGPSHSPCHRQVSPRPTGPGVAGEGWEADTKIVDLVEPKVALQLKVNRSDSDIGAAKGTDLVEPTSPVEPVPAISLGAPAPPPPPPQSSHEAARFSISI